MGPVSRATYAQDCPKLWRAPLADGRPLLLQALFRRAQLKALVNMHSIDENFGGHLSPAEIGIIGGALDLTHKTAAQGMTPLEQVCSCSILAQVPSLTWDDRLLGCSGPLAVCFTATCAGSCAAVQAWHVSCSPQVHIY